MSEGLIEMRIASIKRESAHFIHMRYKQVSPFPGIEEVKELVDNVLLLAAGKPFVLLADLRDIYQNWDSEAKRYITEHEEYNQLLIASAAVINTLPIRLLANLYFSFFKPNGDIKTFDCPKKASVWLEEKRKGYLESALT